MSLICSITNGTTELKLSQEEESLMNSKPAVPVRKWVSSLFPVYFVLCTFFPYVFFRLCSQMIIITVFKIFTRKVVYKTKISIFRSLQYFEKKMYPNDHTNHSVYKVSRKATREGSFFLEP